MISSNYSLILKKPYLQYSMSEVHNNQLHRINFRCHLLCMEPHKSRHQQFTR